MTAARSNKLVTMAEVAKNKDLNIGDVAEVLVQHNAALNDIPYMEMNEGNIHKESIRSGLPAVYYRKANEAMPASKTGTEERSFSAAHFASKSQMEEKVAQRGGADRVAFNRWNQAQGHLQAMAQEHASLLIYGSPETGNRKTPGFFDAYSALTGDETSTQMINAGGSGASDMTSILLAHWGPNSIFGVYPAGSQAGLKRMDRNAQNGGGLVSISALDSNGDAGTIWGYEEEFNIDHGLVIKDYRQAARICNIDTGNLLAGSSAADLLDCMIRASYKIDNPSNGNGVWYVNRTVEAYLHLQALNKVGAGGGLTYQNYQGSQVLMFLGRPIRRMDAILNTEDVVA